MTSTTEALDVILNGMVAIPPGSIHLRDDRVNKRWMVELNSFYLSKFLLRQDLYAIFTGEAPSTFEGKRLPVESISWIDAVNFCNLLSKSAGYRPFYIAQKSQDDVVEDKISNGFRLPTEAEWEYACRAGSNEARYGKIEEISWYSENSQASTHEVGTKKANDWGLYDMLGNVWEWCWDLYDPAVYGPYRIFRGGGWSDPPRGCLASNRRRSHPTFKIDDLGFRLARNLNPKS